jgi:competence/damage-inducible protein CinA C-terminal domain
MKIENEVGDILREKGLTLAVAESCTGGLISSRITDSSGSSDYFLMGVVAYSNKIKENILGVRPVSIKKHGAVSRQVAIEMATGARLLAKTDIGMGVTGIAGPGSGTVKKPVGLVYIAVATNKKRIVKEFRFKGSRLDIKLQASEAALNLLVARV